MVTATKMNASEVINACVSLPFHFSVEEEI